jgi:hypothetical protein
MDSLDFLSVFFFSPLTGSIIRTGWGVASFGSAAAGSSRRAVFIVGRVKTASFENHARAGSDHTLHAFSALRAFLNWFITHVLKFLESIPA